MSAAVQFWGQALVLAALVGLAAYGVVLSLDGRSLAQLSAAWGRVIAPRREVLADAYLKGYEQGVWHGRCAAHREAKKREDDIIPTAYATGYTDGINAAQATRKGRLS